MEELIIGIFDKLLIELNKFAEFMYGIFPFAILQKRLANSDRVKMFETPEEEHRAIERSVKSLTMIQKKHVDSGGCL